MVKIYILKFFCLAILTLGCSDDDCYCVETTTYFSNGEVVTEEYWWNNCSGPFVTTQTFEWGNRVIDCR